MKDMGQQETRSLPEDVDKIFHEMTHILNANQVLLAEAKRLQSQMKQAVTEQPATKQGMLAPMEKIPAQESDLEKRMAELEKMMRQMALVVSKKMTQSEQSQSPAADLEERIRHLEELTQKATEELPPAEKTVQGKRLHGEELREKIPQEKELREKLLQEEQIHEKELREKLPEETPPQEIVQEISLPYKKTPEKETLEGVPPPKTDPESEKCKEEPPPETVSERVPRMEEPREERTREALPRETVDRSELYEEIPTVRQIRNLPQDQVPFKTQPGNSRNSRKKTPSKKKLRKQKKQIIWDVLFYVVLVFFVVGVFLAKGTGGDGQVRTIAGYSAFTVLSSSMEREIPKGSLVITKHVDPGTLRIGDDITYMANQTTTVTHRIIGIIEEYEDTGGRAFETKGIMNENPDKKPVMAVNVVGKVIYHNLTLGKVRDFICDYWAVILFLMVLVGALFRVLRVLLGREKRERNDEM